MSRPNPYPHGIQWTDQDPPNPARDLALDQSLYAELRKTFYDMKRLKAPKYQLEGCRAEMLEVAKRMTKSREALTKAKYKRNKNL